MLMDNLSLLVLEEHVFLRHATVRGLHSLGYRQVLATGNAAGALERLRAVGGIDIAICDVRLPDMDLLVFLRIAARDRLIRALLIVSDIAADLRCAIVQAATLQGLTVLGELDKPLQLPALQARLASYRSHAEMPQPPSALEVWRALSKREFSVCYQPTVDLQTLQPIGLALQARWDDPLRGQQPPALYLPVIRRMNLSAQYFELVLEQALAFASHQHGNGRNWPLSLPLERELLTQPEFTGRLESRLAQGRIAARKLTFEVTQEDLLAAPLASLKNLTRLRLLGCRICLDVCGTDGSSTLPFGRLLANEMKLGACAAAAVRRHAGLALARQLRLPVVADGIQTLEQLGQLRRLGCRSGRGSLLGAVLAETALESALLRQEAQGPRRRDGPRRQPFSLPNARRPLLT